MTSIHTLANRGNPTWRPSLARGWLQNCLQNHPKCTQTDKNWHPTRLLKIYNSEFTTVQLILTAQNRPTSSYLTLSHCWGQLNFLKLTSHTLPQLLAGIRILILPKTFQDAVQIAIFLGIEYIWINSLCILQDSAEDWRVQSSQMGDVYSNGILNIAATSSADGNGGLTIPRDPELNFPYEFQSGREGRLDGPWHLHPRTLSDSKCLLDGTLLSRGWVVQELILAPRTIHFGLTQMFWKCRHHQACETYPGGLPNTMIAQKGNLATFKHFQRIFGSDSDPEITLNEISWFWDRIVERFSRCKLTMEKDKLVAISGLAKRLQERYPMATFVAGMIQQFLESDILWRVKRGRWAKRELVPCRPSIYRAPSWSWASIDAELLLVVSLGTVVSEVLTVEVELVGTDPNGEIKSAALRIAGNLMTVDVQTTLADSELSGRELTSLCINGDLV